MTTTVTKSQTSLSSARLPLIAGNWKMNMDHLQAIALVQKLSWALQDARHDFAADEVVVFPPFTDLRSVQTLLAAEKLSLGLGAQDLSPEESGAYTGDISGSMLSKLDVKYVIVGHSERRGGHGEGDDVVAAKAVAAHRSGLIPIVCVGETAADLEEHGAAKVPVEQLRRVLTALSSDAPLVVAYEPVWAIGSGTPATPEQAQEVAQALRSELQEATGVDRAESTRILYGGSVTSESIARLMQQADIDGALVGGASLKADEFARIVQYRKHVVAG